MPLRLLPETGKSQSSAGDEPRREVDSLTPPRSPRVTRRSHSSTSRGVAWSSVPYVATSGVAVPVRRDAPAGPESPHLPSAGPPAPPPADERSPRHLLQSPART